MTDESHTAPWSILTVIREKDGYSGSGLARKLGMSRQQLNDLERGRQEPSAEMTKRIAVALNVPVSVIEKRRRSDAA